MPKKRKNKAVIVKSIKFVIATLLLCFLVFIVLTQVMEGLKKSKTFQIKRVVLAPFLSFIDSDDLARLSGKNIFTINHIAFQKRLQSKYPQVSHLRVIKRLPDQIYITAIMRNAFAQVHIGSQYLTIDKGAVVLSKTENLQDFLPAIWGVKIKNSHIRLGDPVISDHMKVAIRIIELFKENSKISSQFAITRIDVGNLSRITIFNSDNLKIILDRESINDKLKMLEHVFLQDKIKVKEFKYIDLRFKEPILGKK